MTLPELERLVQAGTLTPEPPLGGEVEGLQRSGEARLADATNSDLSMESRFDLAYNAGHAMALAALRRKGYRPKNRYIVFQILTHTLSIPPAKWRVLAKAHDLRNRTEYEGAMSIDERLVEDMIAAVTAVRDALRTATA